jgi:hypothetical protein
LLRLRERTGFPLTLHSSRFPPDRMNGSGVPRFGAPSITESDLCNRREGRAHPRATRYPCTGVFSADVWPSKAAGGRAPVTRLGVELPLHRSPRPDQASARSTRGLLGSKAGTLYRTTEQTKTRRGSGSLRGPEVRLRPAARTVRPSNEPGYLCAARNRGSSPRPLAGSSGAERERPFFTRSTA